MAVKKYCKHKRVKKTEIKRLRRGIINNQIKRSLKDTNNIMGPVTLGGVLNRE